MVFFPTESLLSPINAVSLYMVYYFSSDCFQSFFLTSFEQFDYMMFIGDIFFMFSSAIVIEFFELVSS